MNLRNVTLTNFISEAEARSVIAKALDGNPSRHNVIVEGRQVTFVEIPSQGFTVVSVSNKQSHLDMVAFATIYEQAEPGDPSKVTIICASCYGRGTVHTGIAESPSTICERCNGTGKV